jgi:hypothetical protein
MTFPNGEQRLELRDTKGTTLGFFLSDHELRELAAEREALRKQVADLQSRLEQVDLDKEALRAEVNNYAKMLAVWEQDGIAPMTRQEMEHLRMKGVSFETVVAEITELVQNEARGA